MTVNPTKNQQSGASTRKTHFQRDIPRAQETIYSFLLEIVREWTPEAVLEEFKRLFIHHTNTVSSATLPSLYEIVFSNQEHEFRNTLKRSCYILINNWDISRNHQAIQTLIRLFSDPIIQRSTVSPTLQRLRTWLNNFLHSKDFEELQLFASRYDEREPIHWRERYTSYLLVPQYIDLNNPLEQRQAARALSRQLRERFKFELAMYTARSEAPLPRDKMPKNPTALGDEVLRLIKMIVAKRGLFNYSNFANIFIKQTQHLSYREFKGSLQKYLTFSVAHPGIVSTLNKQLGEKLELLYVNHHDKQIDDALLLRTCNRVIEYLTTETHQEPSPLFITLMSHGSPLTLVIILIKIILICRNARTHLEARIANLIHYYEEMPEQDCTWVISFFEIFKITMAICAENVEFNLVNMQTDDAVAAPEQPAVQGGISRNRLQPITESYRIFSQRKSSFWSDLDLDNIDALLSPDTSDDGDGPPAEPSSDPAQ